jgi:RNA polymerase sigma-70 factor (ECF subfamily)
LESHSIIVTGDLDTKSDKMSVEFTTQTVLRAQAGSRDAFDQLAELFYSRVYGIVMQRLRNTAEADEVTQEVFLRAFRKITQLNDPAAFAGWLCQIAARLSINRAVRRPADRSCEPMTVELLREADDNPTTRLLQKEDAQQLRCGLDQLGQLDRQTLLAFYFEGQSLKEMAEVFDSPIGTIKRRLHTARNRLRDAMVALQPA